MTAEAKTYRRRGRPRAAHLSNPDLPYTMKLPDGRVVYVEVPGRWVRQGRGGEAELLPDAVDFLDRIRALAMKPAPAGGAGAPTAGGRAPSPGYITALREALGQTQREFGEHVGVDKMTVSRWERGTLRPSDESLAAIEELRRSSVRKGVTLPT